MGSKIEESAKVDVTAAVRMGFIDDEHCTIRRCVCGAEFPEGAAYLTIYSDPLPDKMPCCGARLYFRTQVTVYHVAEP